LELHPTADQILLRDTASRFIAETSPLPEVRRVALSALGYDEPWWRRAVALGWTAPLAPEELGGGSVSGRPVVDLALIAFERGRFVSPGPFVPVNVALAALASSNGRPRTFDDLIARLVAGDAVATLVDGTAEGCRGTVRVSASDGAYLADGGPLPAEAALQAVAFVIVASLEAERALLLIDAEADGVSVSPRECVDLVRRFGTLHLTGARGVVIERVEHAVQRVLDIGAALQLAETVGAIDRVIEFTIEWAFDRHSFGRPLASYQELKHRFADMRTWLEACKATSVAAVHAVAAGTPDASMLTSVAKAYVGEHAPAIVQDCIQMHGGLGVTWEHDLHLYLRRVMLNGATFGSVTEHRRRLGALAVAASTQGE
jgi:alkylation response protein AidB-like acyl-CoA dehydrogenase